MPLFWLYCPFLHPMVFCPLCFMFTLLVPVSFVLGYPICFCILCFGLCPLCLCPFGGGSPSLFLWPLFWVHLLCSPVLYVHPLFWVYLQSSCNLYFRLPFLFLHWNILRLLIGVSQSFLSLLFPLTKNQVKKSQKIIKTVLLESDLLSVGIYLNGHYSFNKLTVCCPPSPATTPILLGQFMMEISEKM